MDLAWRASAARRRTSPFRSREVESNEDPTRFLTFLSERSGGLIWTSGHLDIWTYQSLKSQKNKSEVWSFPPKAWRRVVGVGVSSCHRVIVRRHDEWAPKLWKHQKKTLIETTLEPSFPSFPSFVSKFEESLPEYICFLCFLSFLICFVCFWVAFWTFFWSLKQTIFFVEKRNVKKRVWRALSTKTSWTTAVSLFFTLDHAANRRPHTMHTQTSESKVCKVSTSSCQKSRQLSSQCSVNAQSSQLSSSHGTKGMQKRCIRQWVTNTQRWQFGTTKKIWWKWHQGEGKERWSESYIAVVQKLWNVVFCICDILCMRLHQIPLMFLQNPSKMFGIHNSSLICCMNPPALYESHPWSCTTLIPYKTQINRTGAKPFLRILSHSRPQT